MKINIGEYNTWFGAYQLANLLQHVGVSEDKCFEIGEKLSHTWVHSFLKWIDSKKKRKIKVKIDGYDTWSLDHTLALVIAPALEEFKKEICGWPGNLDKEDHPENLKELEAWKYILDEMIFAFKSNIDDSWEDQFHSGTIDHQSKEVEIDGEKMYELVVGPNDTYSFDREGYDKYYARIKNGYRLFGKYYDSLWN